MEMTMIFKKFLRKIIRRRVKTRLITSSTFLRWLNTAFFGAISAYNQSRRNRGGRGYHPPSPDYGRLVKSKETWLIGVCANQYDVVMFNSSPKLSYRPKQKQILQKRAFNPSRCRFLSLHISIEGRGADYAHPISTCTPQIFRPSYGPDILPRLWPPKIFCLTSAIVSCALSVVLLGWDTNKPKHLRKSNKRFLQE